MLRSYIAIPLAIAYTIVTGIPALLLTACSPGSDFVLWFGRYWSRWILATAGVRLEASGRENIEKGRPLVYLCNHQSNLDPLALVLTMPTSFRIVAKKFLFYIPIFGQCIWLMGMIPIDREKRGSAIRSLKRAAERIRTGTSVLFFPEGTRSPDERLLPFKKGAFVIAVESGVPIIPVTIQGSGRLLPKGSALIRKGTMRIHYGRPIATVGYTLRTKEELMTRVREAMLAGLGQEESWPSTPGAVRNGPESPLPAPASPVS